MGEDLCRTVTFRASSPADTTFAYPTWRAADEGREQPEERRVGVNVVERCTVLNLRVVVEDVRVQTGVHALSRAACAEGTASTEENLHRRNGVDVGVVN